MCEASIAVCCGNLGTNRKTEGLLASCNHRMLRYISKKRWQDRITNEKVRKRCGMENLKHRMRFRWFAHVKRRDESSIIRRAMELNWKVEGQLVDQRRPGLR